VTHPVIAAVVEGQGEVAAVPVLLSRLLSEIAPGRYFDLPRPYRIGRGTLLAPSGIERAVAAIGEQRGPRVGVLVLLDADDDCPAELSWARDCWPAFATSARTGPRR
jgi:hypothetical protein